MPQDQPSSTDQDRGARERSRGLLYGRRKGKTLRANRRAAYETGQARFALDLSIPCADPRALFGQPIEALAMEIGFGGGEHLLHQLSDKPSSGFIGCEPFVNGMARLLEGACQHPGAARLRTHEGDARDVLRWLPPRCLAIVYLLYPDPWPKLRHEKRRFIAGDTLSLFARVLEVGGELRLATDIEVYKQTALKAVHADSRYRIGTRNPAEAWPDWAGTRYEAKALREGRQPSYFSFFLENVAR
ncbi:MAG: tRNA (guanosine(46)-N7)-methyltransferase TrmB [Pseudomonadota bacterium]